MFLTVLVSVFVTLWILFCAALYGYHYILEVTLDLPIPGPSPYSPSTAHAALKKIIENLLKECGAIPKLEQAQEHHPVVPSAEANRTYEDLLATAIINKVITACQNNGTYSSANSVSSRVSTSSRHRGRDSKEYFFGEETLDSKWKTTDLDSTSVSSIEEWLHSESSYGSKKYVDHMTLTIKQDIEEVFPSDSENEADTEQTEYFRPNSSSLIHDDDDTNWFLQKKQFQGSHSPVPVPMLVPDPTTEAKVLIGDKELDDTSDLSDVASDYGESEPLPGRHSLLIESKTVIGGKNSLDLGENHGRESGSSSDSGVKEVNGKVGVMEDLHRAIPVMTDITVDDDNVEDSSIMSVYSNTEQDADYTERYASLPRTVLKPTPSARPSLERQLRTAAQESNTVQESVNFERISGREDQESPFSEFEGSYSKREKEKWKHAVEMKNNPYSKENIEKRIKRSNSSASSVFGPDYYIRQASSPAGGKTNQEATPVWPPQQFSTPEDNNIQHSSIPDDTDNDVFVSIESSKDIPNTVSEVPEPKSSVSEITSDSDISYTNYYDVENGKVYKQNKNGIQVIVPEPKMYVATPLEQNSNAVQKYKAFSEDELETKPKGMFIKASNNRRTFPQKKEEKPPLRRFKSESDLLDDDSFDKPPTVLHKRKDNTLISRIYLDPNVRNFALRQREQLPVKNTESISAFKKQTSSDPTFLSVTKSKKSSISSDEGLLSDRDSKTGKMSFFSSDDEHASIEPEIIKTPRTTLHYSTDEGLLSDATSNLKDKSTLSKVYSSSSDDLLSINGTSGKKKDNTLISKIYLEPNVQNYVQIKKINIPHETESQSPSLYSSDDNLEIPKSNHLHGNSKSLVNLHSDLLPQENIKKNGNYESNNNISKQLDPNINEVAKKRVVHNILGQLFSKSQQNLVENNKKRDDIESTQVGWVSVKDLRKRFECNNEKKIVISSLTARSLSKQMREDLKQ